ncbi:MAG: glycosyltransferase, partial [Anaerolineae bacterium]
LPPVAPAYNGFRETIPPDCGVLVPTTRNGQQKYPDVYGLAQAISDLLGDREALREKSQHAIHHAQRFARETAQKAMLEKFSFVKPEHRIVSAPERSFRVTLERYPTPIRDLWAGIEGEPIAKLLAEFLRTGEPPVRPAHDAYQRFHEAWFANY